MATNKVKLIDQINKQSIGRIQPLAFQRYVNNYFMSDVRVSRHRKVEPVINRKAVLDIDIEKTENRFVVSGATDGCLAIHSLWKVRRPPRFTTHNICDIGSFALVGIPRYNGFNAHKGRVERVQWCPWDKKNFTSSSLDKTMKLWDTDTLTPIQVYNMGYAVRCHQMPPNNGHGLIAVGTDTCGVFLVDTRIPLPVNKLCGHRKGKITCVQWSNLDDNLLATGSTDMAVLLWDIRKPKSLMKLRETVTGNTHARHIHAVMFSPDGFNLITIGADLNIFRWDVATGQKIAVTYPQLNKIDTFSLRCCLVPHASEEWLFVPTGVYTTRLNLSGPQRSMIKLYGHNGFCTCVAYDQRENMLLSGGHDNRIVVYTHIRFRSRRMVERKEVGVQTLF